MTPYSDHESLGTLTRLRVFWSHQLLLPMSHCEAVNNPKTPSNQLFEALCGRDVPSVFGCCSRSGSDRGLGAQFTTRNLISFLLSADADGGNLYSGNSFACLGATVEPSGRNRFIFRGANPAGVAGSSYNFQGPVEKPDGCELGRTLVKKYSSSPSCSIAFGGKVITISSRIL